MKQIIQSLFGRLGQGAGLFLSVLIQMTLIHKKQSQVYNERSTNGRAYRKSERFKK